MATVHVQHTIGDLSRDMLGVAKKVRVVFPKVVARNAREGNRIAQRFARGAAGPHGTNYWKRMSAEAISPLEWEYGPHDGGTPVGAGYRHGPPNTDMAKSADVIGPKFAADVSKQADRLFW